MFIEEFYIEINDSVTLKVSIWDEVINNQKVFYSKYVNVNLPIYKENRNSGNSLYGIEYTEYTNGPIIYYFDKDKFISDLKVILKTDKRLKSQI